MKKPKIITLCGSSKFVEIMAVCAWLIERDEKAITMGLHLLPFWYGDIPDHLAEVEGVAKEMDDLHLKKINISNEVFIVDFGGYVGESTYREIRFAKEKNKKVRFYTLDPIGEKVNELIREHNLENGT